MRRSRRSWCRRGPKPTICSFWRERLSITPRWNICTISRIAPSKPGIPVSLSGQTASGASRITRWPIASKPRKVPSRSHDDARLPKHRVNIQTEQIERSAAMPASIYVADDEPVLLNALVKRLSQSQHQVKAFKSGDELLAAVEQGLPDLILLDLKMPGRTGIEILEALRKKSQDAMVVILTAYGTVEEAVEAMKLGAYDFIIKTVDLQLVDTVVNRALEHLALRRQVASVAKEKAGH